MYIFVLYRDVVYGCVHIMFRVIVVVYVRFSVSLSFVSYILNNVKVKYHCKKVTLLLGT